MRDHETNYALQAYLRSKDKERRQALSAGDHATYAGLCDELGIEPELHEEYKQGKADLESQLQEALKGLERIITRQEKPASKEDTIERFLKATEGYTDSLFEGSELKTQALIKYFPRRFGPKGSQPLKGYNDTQRCAIFNYVKDTYKNKNNT
ncbi:hypothetical protein JXA12_03765 [Candidatus Woesearchaeota archaeon]|nr:hypothetical protein [Candidatus Woesearchaeota archaeon]